MTAPDGGGDTAERRVFLSLGSNLGDRRAHLSEALTALGSMVTGMSSVYGTAPVGGPEQGQFLNIVVELSTDLSPRDLLGVCRRLESAAERVRVERWGPRTLDVDILWIEGITVDEEDLQVPHPRMWERRFVLAPLRELAPDLVDEDMVEASHGVVEVVEPLLIDATGPEGRAVVDEPAATMDPDER